jgi:hypothetical protein
MVMRTREFGTAILAGLVVGGVVTVVLDLAQLAFSTVIGAFIGGVVAAYVLYGKISQATIAGALSALLGVPFIFGLSYFLLIYEVVPIPTGETPDMAMLQLSLAVLVLMNLVAGALGGAIFAAFRHPSKGIPPPPPSLQGTVTGQVRYCVQCGAQLPTGALICPQCNARQP